MAPSYPFDSTQANSYIQRYARGNAFCTVTRLTSARRQKRHTQINTPISRCYDIEVPYNHAHTLMILIITYKRDPVSISDNTAWLKT